MHPRLNVCVLDSGFRE